MFSGSGTTIFNSLTEKGLRYELNFFFIFRGFFKPCVSEMTKLTDI